MNSTPLTTDASSSSLDDSAPQIPLVQSPPALTTVQAIGLLVCYLAMWLLTHVFRGLDHDGQLYAFQALARLKPGMFATDLFLGKGLQDNFTLFTPLYAELIQHFGVSATVGSLVIASQIAMLAAAWWIAARLFDRRYAWLAVGMLIVIDGYYGGRHVFKFAEEFVTARTPSEVIGLAAIAFWFYGRRTLGLALGVISLALHPLMGLPCLGIVVLGCVPFKHWPKVLLAGAAFVALVFLAAALFPNGPLSSITGEWLEIVKIRSPHLFAQSWKYNDWNQAGLAFGTLIAAWRVLAASDTPRVRELILGTGIVGLAGLLLTVATSLILPVHLIMMGQPQRWLWITTLLAILLAGPTILTLLKTAGTPRWIGMLLASAWLIAERGGGILAAAALAAWVLGSVDGGRYTKYVRYMSIAATVVAVASLAAQAMSLAEIDLSTGIEARWIEWLRNIFGIRLVTVAVVVACWYLITTKWVSVPATLVTLGAAFVLANFAPALAAAFEVTASYSKYTAAQPAFESWRRAIPVGANVFWLNENLANWMLLERPSYLSVSTSAGVVFSREIALEVVRRAHNLREYVDEDYMLGVARANEQGEYNFQRRMTLEIMESICTDPQLGFVVSSGNVGPSLENQSSNPDWKYLRLYDCSKYRKAQP